MNTGKKNISQARRARASTSTVRATASPRGIRTRVASADNTPKPTKNSQKGILQKGTAIRAVRQVPSPMTTVRLRSENDKTIEEEAEQKPRLTALEELFPKHVLDEIRNNSEPSSFEEEDGRFYKLLMQSIYVTDKVVDDLPENMTMDQLEQAITNTQKDMEELEEKLQIKERQRARLLRWWEVKHDMLSYLFKCKSERVGNHDAAIHEQLTTSTC